MDEIGPALLYFGSLLIPVRYFVSTRFRGRLNRLMLIGLALQIVWSLAVWAFVYYSWAEGYSEYYWGWALLIPVNFIAAIYFFVFIPLWVSRTKRAEQGSDGKPDTAAS